MHGRDVVSLSNLVPLMYRARWLRFFLSGEVTSREQSQDGAGWVTGSLLAAPGGTAPRRSTRTATAMW
jgi:hypothetical protein